MVTFFSYDKLPESIDVKTCIITLYICIYYCQEVIHIYSYHISSEVYYIHQFIMYMHIYIYHVYTPYYHQVIYIIYHQFADLEWDLNMGYVTNGQRIRPHDTLAGP